MGLKEMAILLAVVAVCLIQIDADRFTYGKLCHTNRAVRTNGF